MMIVSMLLMSGVCAAPPLENAMPVKITGPWTIEVGPGAITCQGREIALKEPVTIAVEPPRTVSIKDEPCAPLPPYKKDAAGWTKGARLKGLIAEECTATGLLLPDTVRVKAAAGEGPLFKRGVDYDLDPLWGTYGRLEGSIRPDQTVYVDYDYCPRRLDSIAVAPDGKVRCVPGTPHVALAMPPELGPGEVALANVFLNGPIPQLSDESVFPIEFREYPLPAPVAEQLLPKTLAKLRAGQPVTIVAFGDSVTNGGGVGARENEWYQNQFAALLRQRFPKSEITMLTAAWPGGSSQMCMDAKEGAVCSFTRDVLARKPDLVTIEFVNDAYLDEAATAEHYGIILKQLRDIGAETAIITPHLVRPDWLKSDTLKVDADPRPFVKGLRQFAADSHVALADASASWCHLWREGIPYITLLANDINHPDVRGHALFARRLLALFPES